MTRSDEKVSPWKEEGSRFFPWAELGVVLVYIVGASLWNVLTDMALDRLDLKSSVELQTFKGMNFVATTAVLLYVVLQRSFNRWRRAEKQLLESEQRFEYAGRAATDAIWDWDLATKSLWWSDGFYKTFGYSREEVPPTTHSWTLQVHPEDRERSQAVIRNAMESGQQMWHGEYRFRRKDGNYAYVEDRGYILRDGDGQAVRAIGGLTDVTARKLAEEKLDRSRRQLRSLSARLQHLREEERTRIAREIHDELGQTLTGLKMDLRWAERRLAKDGNPALHPVVDRLLEAGELVDTTIASVQRISAELRPSLLEDLGLAAALKQEAQRFQERSNIVCAVQAGDLPFALSLARATAVFRIFQEALTNVARHSGATRVEVELGPKEGQLMLSVADNGKGIQPSDLDDPKSLGLLGMRERAEMLGGEISFQPGGAGGTLVSLRLPPDAKAPSAPPATK
jgi:two-component system, NarL family, sensor histidine kinase UhpB